MLGNGWMAQTDYILARQALFRAERASRGERRPHVQPFPQSAKRPGEADSAKSASLIPRLTPCWRPCSTETAHELNQRQASALEELRLFRTTLDSLKARLPALEYFVANSSLKEEEEDAELERIVRSFGDPVTTIESTNDERDRAGESSTAAEPASKRPRTSLSNTHAGTSTISRAKGKQKEDPDEGEAGVEASVNLEFYALGRPRVWAEPHLRTSSLNDAGPTEEAEGSGPSSSPSHRHAVLPAVPEGQPVESPVSLFPNAEALKRAAPTEEQERVILAQGLDVYGFHVRHLSAATRR